MSEITRREWLHRTGGLAVGAGIGSLVGEPGVRLAAAQGQPKRGGVLRVATVDKPVNMDPGYAQLYSSLQVYQNVYNKLVYVDEASQFIPGLAKSWKQEDDKTWLFDLVDNATFHNGEPFSSKDVVFTFTRIIDAKNKLPMRVFFSSVEGVEAVGPSQVRFHLNRPWGPILAVLAQATEVVNEKALQQKDPKLFPIGTGPYRFAEWVKDDHITLERWDKYHRPGRPYLDKIIFYSPPDDTVRLTGLQTGRFNWIQTVPPQRIGELERARDMKSSAGRPYFPFYFMLNASKPPLADKRLRQAIAWAVDRGKLRFTCRLLFRERSACLIQSFIRVIQAIGSIDARKHCLEAVIILLADRVELMVVAASAMDRQAAERRHRVCHHVIPVERPRDLLVHRPFLEFVG